MHVDNHVGNHVDNHVKHIDKQSAVHITSSDRRLTATISPSPTHVLAAEKLGHEIAQLAANIHAATARLLKLVRQFDEEARWCPLGFRSCAHWLSWRVGYDPRTAREKVRVAHALKVLPLISTSFAAGEVSYAKVREVTRIARPDNEEALLAVAKHGTGAQVQQLVSRYRRAAEVADRQTKVQRQAARAVTSYTDEDGMVVIEARLPPEIGEVVLKALEVATEMVFRPRGQRDDSAGKSGPAGPLAGASSDPAGRSGPAGPPGQPALEPAAYSQQRADAFGLIAESFLEHGPPNGGRDDRCQVVLHVDVESLCSDAPSDRAEFESGRVASLAASQAICCDSSTVMMVHDSQGNVLDVGRRTRKISPHLRRALRQRDRCCAFPGCDNAHLLDAHHIRAWADGGETKLDNLLHLCRYHHGLLHREGYRIEHGKDHEMIFYSPKGEPLRPAGPPVEHASAERLFADNAKKNVYAGPSTITTWGGERMDVDWIAPLVL